VKQHRLQITLQLVEMFTSTKQFISKQLSRQCESKVLQDQFPHIRCKDSLVDREYCSTAEYASAAVAEIWSGYSYKYQYAFCMAMLDRALRNEGPERKDSLQAAQVFLIR